MSSLISTELKHAFVLGPQAQIAPDYVNPETGISLVESLGINTSS
jgi:hypothetical protein